MDFLVALQKKFPELPDASEIAGDEDFIKFFTVPKKGRKKKSLPEDRRGAYDGERCGARVWHEKKGTGGLGYDDIQCSHKKVDGCFCKRHAKSHAEGNLWTGLINEPRPEPPTKPDGTVMGWSTDSDGNDVVKEKKKKSSPKKKAPPKKKKEKKKSAEDLTVEELEALLAKKKETPEEGEEGGVGAGVDPKNDEKEEKEEKKEKKKKEEKKEEEEKDEEEGEEEEGEEDEIFMMKEIDGVEYQINKEDNQVIRVDDFDIVGKWDPEKETIDFNDESDEE